MALSALLERLRATRKLVVGEDLHGSALPLAESRSLLVVAPQTEIGWWREAIDRFDRPEPVVTANYSPRRFGLAETARLLGEVVRPADSAQWKIVEDELTGTLVVTTTPSRHLEIEKLLERLEATDLGPRRPMRAFTVHHRQVEEVVRLLEELVDAGVLREEEDPSVTGTQAPAPRGATGTLPASARRPRPGEAAPQVTLAADEATNRIVAFGEARLLDQIGVLIETIDVQHSQILVEALVVSLTQSQARDLGVELQKIGSDAGTSAQLASLFGLGSPDPAATAIPPAAGAGFSGVVLDPGDFSAAVRALETINDGRSLTIPKVLVNNNQEATLDSTLQTPYTSTNASQTVATTSFGGTLDAGTSILVKPQVAEGDQILLDYTISLSSFTGEAADNLPPPRQENRLQSVATVPDGHTVVVGGLEVDTEGEVVSRVPLLGSLPIVGHLFQSRSTTMTRSRFFVFLRCNVMRGATFEELKYASEPMLQAAGIDDGWPELEPRLIR